MDARTSPRYAYDETLILGRAGVRAYHVQSKESSGRTGQIADDRHSRLE